MDLLTPKEAAPLLHFNFQKVLELCREKKIRHIKRANRYFIPRDAIDEYFQSLIIEPDVKRTSPQRFKPKELQDDVPLHVGPEKPGLIFQE